MRCSVSFSPGGSEELLGCAGTQKEKQQLRHEMKQHGAMHNAIVIVPYSVFQGSSVRHRISNLPVGLSRPSQRRARYKCADPREG